MMFPHVAVNPSHIRSRSLQFLPTCHTYCIYSLDLGISSSSFLQFLRLQLFNYHLKGERPFSVPSIYAYYISLEIKAELASGKGTPTIALKSRQSLREKRGVQRLFMGILLPMPMVRELESSVRELYNPN